MWRSRATVAALALALARNEAWAADDGLARTPPMGWRSWNQYGRNIDQGIMEATAAAMAVKRNSAGEPDPDGESLLDFGYDDVGLDDNWQACGAGPNHTFHDSKGVPLINEKRFPDMKGMVDHIHEQGFKAGFYHNNCICREKNAKVWSGDDHYEGDVKLTLDLGFDSVKLDGCGAFRDLDKWYKLFNDGRPSKVMIENCHWGGDAPRDDWCPFHIFRTTGDVKAHWSSMWHNFQSTRRFQGEKPLSRPGCWAYPDMLEVGKLATVEEDRAHFGAWVITSSPLILGHNVTDEATNRKVWPFITNKRVLAINQAWAGHPGRLAFSIKGKGGRDVQVWVKPLPAGSLALFVINDNEAAKDGSKDRVAVNLKRIGASGDASYAVRDVWSDSVQTDALEGNEITVEVGGHDSALLQLDPK